MNIDDFGWPELGDRIRRRRLLLGKTQEDVATAAELTQNAIHRIEVGGTNPQLSTLQRVARVLGCSVRELFTGFDRVDAHLEGRELRIRRILESGDAAAIQVMDNGIQAAETILDRSTGRRGLPPLKLKGEGRQAEGYALLRMQGPVRRRLPAGENDKAKVATKGHYAFTAADAGRSKRKEEKR